MLKKISSRSHVEKNVSIDSPSPSGCDAIISFIWASSNALHNSSSLCSFKGSRFSLDKKETIHGNFEPWIISNLSWLENWLFLVLHRSVIGVINELIVSYLILPLNIITSWGIADSLDRNVTSDISRRSTPSTIIRPCDTSNNWKSAINVEDLPLPVLPQIPNFGKKKWKIHFLMPKMNEASFSQMFNCTFWPDGIRRLRFWTTGSVWDS